MGKPLKQYIQELKSMEPLKARIGRPQKLQIVGENLYWLQGTVQELFRVPLAGDTAAAPLHVIQGAKAGLNADEDKAPLTKEEELLRERQRTQSTGMSSYRVRSSDGAVFYTASTDLYIYKPGGPEPQVLKVFDYITSPEMKERLTASGKPNMCIQHIECPGHADGEAAALSGSTTTVTFVNDGNIYVATIKECDAGATALSVEVQQVTTVGNGSCECGTADYIIQEEFDRYTGHYATEKHVLFSYFDSSTLRTLSLVGNRGGAGNDDVETMQYARVGDDNIHVSLAVFDRTTGRLRVVPHSAIAKVAPWVEYIPRYGFKDADTIYLSLLSRTQEKYCVVSCPIASLPEISESELPKWHRKECGTDAVVDFRMELAQEIPWAWVEIPPGAPIVFSSAYDVTLRHESDSPTAHFHLLVRPAGAGADQWRPLTAGAWNVQPGTVKVTSDRVFFVANAHGVLQNVLYSVPLCYGEAAVVAEKLHRVTAPDECVLCYAVDGGKLAYVATTIDAPAQLHWMSLADSDPVAKRRTVNSKWVPEGSGFGGVDIVIPSVFTVKSRRDVPLGVYLFVSPCATSKGPQPLVMHVYGGPHVQLVYEHGFTLTCEPWIQCMLKQGISVAVVENQMSNVNGLRTLSICKKNMGFFETDDYIDVARYLCDSKSGLSGGFVADAARVGICGWSYGGYATLLAMSQAPDCFKLGYSGAPVGDFRLYDTGYTERYMGELYEKDPVANELKENEAYIKCAIRNFASGFPDELHRLFIAHGLLDENVHFSHSGSIVEALIEAEKPYAMLVYPGERHGLRQKTASKLYNDAMLMKTMADHL